MDAEKQIASILKDFETSLGIQILFAVENGSRAWKMESRDSDYDVRFVFRYPAERYLGLEKPADVLNAAFDAGRTPCAPTDALYDFSGFEVGKYAGLLAKSNSTVLEWLLSDIVYYGDNNLPVKEYMLRHFNPAALFYHYRSLCRRTFEGVFSKKPTHKKYLYMFRGLVNALFVRNKRAVPPLNFREALGLCRDGLPPRVFQAVEELIQVKSQGKEKDESGRIPLFDAFIQEFLDEPYDIPERPAEIAFLDAFVRETRMKPI